MRTLILIFIGLMSLYFIDVSANEYDQRLQELMKKPVNCSVKFTDPEPFILLYWDGDCKNGYVDGPGMMLYKRQSNNYPGRYIGQFKEGSMEKDTIWMLTIMTNKGSDNDFTSAILSGSTNLYGTWDKDPFFSSLKSSKNWVKNTNFTAGPDNTKYAALSYQDLLIELENDFNRLKPTMSFYKFKSYLENPWNDGWTSGTTISAIKEGDDPPALGKALKPSRSIKKKKR